MEDLLNDISWECRDSIGLHLRGQRVRGEDKHKGHADGPGGSVKVDVAALVKKSNKAFKEDFEEGTFQRLEAFARQRNLAHFPVDMLKAHIEHKLGLEVIEDEYGNVGVDIPDQNDGEYRWKRGRKKAVGTAKHESYTSKETAEERYQNLLDKFKSKGLDFSCGSPTQLLGGSQCPVANETMLTPCHSERSPSPARSQASVASSSLPLPGHNKSSPPSG